jgi:hypothetical protein
LNILGFAAYLLTTRYGLSGLAVNFLLVIMLWRSRKRVARAIWPGSAAGELPQGSIREKFAKSWHFFAIAYVIIIGIYWFVNALTGRGLFLSLSSPCSWYRYLLASISGCNGCSK